MSKQRVINIGLLGLGVVGSGVLKIIRSQGSDLAKKTGLRFNVKKICVRSLSKKRDIGVPRSLLTLRADDLLKDSSIHILVELIGGIHPAEDIIGRAFASGKHVVTANKALLAEKGDKIFATAAKHSKQLGIEASVCGGIPIIQSLRNGLVSNNISHFFGIVNGTCNFILSEMSKNHLSFTDALKLAQKNGYAEQDPSLDIEGIDSAHKLAVLARLAFGKKIDFGSIYAEGIRSISHEDIAYARELGYCVKLLAIGKKIGDALELRVHPTMLPLDHPLASVQGSYNAVFINGDQTGDLLFYGRGAGSLPTASAVMSDLVDIGKKIGADRAGYQEPVLLEKARVFSMNKVFSKYYLRFQVKDKPGVLGRIAQKLGSNHISILSVHQKESHSSGSVPVVILTYAAHEAHLKKALSQIDKLGDVQQKTVFIRVEK